MKNIKAKIIEVSLAEHYDSNSYQEVFITQRNVPYNNTIWFYADDVRDQNFDYLAIAQFKVKRK